MEDITIQNLITEHQNRIPYLRYYNDEMIPYYEYPDMDLYYKWREKTKRLIEINYSNIVANILTTPSIWGGL